MSAAKYFAYAAELLKLHPPHVTDQPMIARMRRIGIEPGKSFDLDKADAVVKRALESVPDAAQKLMTWKVATLARVANGWSMNTDTMGVYGNYYLKRAVVAQVGLGANLPEDAIYPTTLADSDGRPYDSGKKYVLRFPKGQIPPVRAFWSLTVYNDKQFFAANPLNRYAIGDRDRLKFNKDGSLDLYVQNVSPGKDKESNWLPAPVDTFNLMMRLYWPKPPVLDGTWVPPQVRRL